MKISEKTSPGRKTDWNPQCDTCASSEIAKEDISIMMTAYVTVMTTAEVWRQLRDELAIEVYGAALSR